MIQELAGCCDVPDAVVKCLPDISVNRASMKDFPFVNAPPAKLLGGFATSLHHTLPREVRTQGTEGQAESTRPQSADDSTLDEGPPEILYGRDKAAKNDDAAIPYGYWDNEILRPWSQDSRVAERLRDFFMSRGSSPMDSFRILALRFWRRMIWKSFRRFIKRRFEDWTHAPEDEDVRQDWESTKEAARDCINRCMKASWWEWSAGSRLLFWRWPQESQEWARDGLPITLTRTPTPYRRLQPKEPDSCIVAAVRSKLEKFRSKGYVSKGTVKGLTSYFTVPKGDGDVRVVFDGTKSGLNEVIWTPSFSLPSANTLLSALEPGTWMADIDVGEQFYNFLLDPKVRPYCGLDLSPYLPEVKTWEHWCRCVMGIKASPYGSMGASAWTNSGMKLPGVIPETHTTRFGTILCA
jgi:hypothetical protein